MRLRQQPQQRLPRRVAGAAKLEATAVAGEARRVATQLATLGGGAGQLRVAQTQGLPRHTGTRPMTVTPQRARAI